MIYKKVYLSGSVVPCHIVEDGQVFYTLDGQHPPEVLSPNTRSDIY